MAAPVTTGAAHWSLAAKVAVSAADVVLLEAIYPTGRIDSATASWRVLSGEEGKSLLQQLKRN